MVIVMPGCCQGWWDSRWNSHGSLLNLFHSCSQTVTNKVYFDVEIEGGESGRITLGLFGENVPKTVENFVSSAGFVNGDWWFATCIVCLNIIISHSSRCISLWFLWDSAHFAREKRVLASLESHFITREPSSTASVSHGTIKRHAWWCIILLVSHLFLKYTPTTKIDTIHWFYATIQRCSSQLYDSR